MPDFIKSFWDVNNIQQTPSEELHSNEKNILWVMISNCLTHESDDLKPDWFVLRSFSLSRKE